jgi:hypothetical protein
MRKFNEWATLKEQDSQGQEQQKPTPLPGLVGQRLQMLIAEIEKLTNLTRQQQLEIFNQVIQALHQYGLQKSQATMATNQAFQTPAETPQQPAAVSAQAPQQT